MPRGETRERFVCQGAKQQQDTNMVKLIKKKGCVPSGKNRCIPSGKTHRKSVCQGARTRYIPSGKIHQGVYAKGQKHDGYQVVNQQQCKHASKAKAEEKARVPTLATKQSNHRCGAMDERGTGPNSKETSWWAAAAP